MNIERFPNDLILTVDDIQQIDLSCIEVIDNFHNFHSILSKKARQAMEDGNHAKGKIFWLLADACSMALQPDNIHEPLVASIVLLGNRSAILDDFRESDISFFESILPYATDYRLKARLADILWLKQLPRNVSFALEAIDAYSSYPLSFEEMVESKVIWHRAITLSLQLRKVAEDRLESLQTLLYSKFLEIEFDSSQKIFLHWLSELLMAAKTDREKGLLVALKLRKFAEFAKEQRDWYFARIYLNSAVEWYQYVRDHQSDIYQLHYEIGETFRNEAEDRLNSVSPSVAGHFFEMALKAYRNIPRKVRAQYQLDEKIHEVHEKMNEANLITTENLHTIKTEGIDISEMVESAQKHVAGLDLVNALKKFANIISSIKREELYNSAKTVIKHSFLSSMFGATHLASDGRIIAKTAGCDFTSSDDDATNTAIKRQMLQSYIMQIGLTAQAYILPALEVINIEHRITERDLFTLCQNSRIIPPNREALWAKGLYFGFEKDFVISSHLLIPQIENLVRYVLKQNHIKTTTLDTDGIETENGLSTLLKEPIIESIFGEDLAFDMKALLVEPIGGNLRNEIAHGLSEYNDLMSYNSVYLWWLWLKLILNNAYIEISTEEED